MKCWEFSAAVATALAAAPLGLLTPAFAQQLGTLKMMIPANPGGGWDQTGRELGKAMQSRQGREIGPVRQQGRRRRHARARAVREQREGRPQRA